MSLHAEKILDDAIEAHQKKNFIKATQLYLELLKENPINPDANHNLGVLTVQTGKPKESLLFLETAIQSNPHVSQYWISLIDALIKLDRNKDALQILMQAKRHGHKDDVLSKIEDYLKETNKKLSKEIDEPETLLIEKLIESRNFQNYKESIEEIDIYIKKYPKSVKLQHLKGMLLLDESNYTEAVKWFTKALKLDPDNSNTLTKLGIAQLYLGSLNDAQISLEKSTNFNPKNAETYFYLGEVFSQKGIFKEAIGSYKQCAKINANHELVYLGLANAYSELGDRQRASRCIKRLIGSEPKNYEALCKLAYIFKSFGNFSESNKVLPKSTGISPARWKSALRTF